MSDLIWPDVYSYAPNIKVESGKHLDFIVGREIPSFSNNSGGIISRVTSKNVGTKQVTDIEICPRQQAAGTTPQSYLWKRYITTDNQTSVWIFDIPSI